MKLSLCILFLGFFACPLFSQQSIRYKASLSGQVATEHTLPFWATTGRYGIVPDSRGGLLQAGIFSDFNPLKSIQWAFGASGAGYLTQEKHKIILDELYLSIKWKKLHLDLGLKHPEKEYDGLSSQNGNIVFSGNSRPQPGYLLKSEYIPLPLTKEVLAFRFEWGDYTLIDKRYVDKPRLHHKSLYLRISPWHRLDIHVGLEHWVQWAGTSPLYGKQPDSFRDYLKIFGALAGGEDATLSDNLNALGNHLGREHLRIDYKAEHHTLSFYHDIPYEDGSGTRFANFPDGTWGICLQAQDKIQWINGIMYEFIYTKKQSGSQHDRPATEEEIAGQDPHSHTYGRVVIGGNDNYFNNGEYRSGWTYYGRTVGTPFITPKASNEEGITLGVYNNRIAAHYIGIKGYIAKKLPYLLRLSYSFNYGTYGQPLKESPEQFSFGLETALLRKADFPLHLDLGLYGDYGKLFNKNIGISLKISRNGTF